MSTCSWFSLYYLYESHFNKIPKQVVTSSVTNSTIERQISIEKKNEKKKKQEKAASAIRNIFVKYNIKKRTEQIEMDAALVIQSIVRFRAIKTIVKLKKRMKSASC